SNQLSSLRISYKILIHIWKCEYNDAKLQTHYNWESIRKIQNEIYSDCVFFTMKDFLEIITARLDTAWKNTLTVVSPVDAFISASVTGKDGAVMLTPDVWMLDLEKLLSSFKKVHSSSSTTTIIHICLVTYDESNHLIEQPSESKNVKVKSPDIEIKNENISTSVIKRERALSVDLPILNLMKRRRPLPIPSKSEDKVDELETIKLEKDLLFKREKTESETEEENVKTMENTVMDMEKSHSSELETQSTYLDSPTHGTRFRHQRRE
ncbi:hypothetical protein ACO22_07711, partial [Paracoccidioides brasiliensis]